MYKLYFELSEFDNVGQIVHTDSFIVNLDRSGLFLRLILFLRNFLKKRSPNNIFEEFDL